MQAQTARIAPSAINVSLNALVCYRLVLWAALLTYPLLPALFFRSGSLAGTSALLAGGCVLLVYAWALAGPVAAWLALGEADRLKLNRCEYPQLVREGIMAAVGASFFVLSGVILGWLHFPGRQSVLWYIVLAGVAAARWLPPPKPRVAWSVRWHRVHRISAVLLVLFGVAHVANHTAAIASLQAHVTIQNMLRVVYRQPVVEAVVVAAALLQVWTGWLIVSGVRLQRSTGLRNLQLLAGAFLGMFFLSHLTGVASGRFLQGVDTTFGWATGGPGGLLTNPRSPSFIPYYSLAVFAFLVHAAVAARWTFAPAIGQKLALKLCYGIIVIGAIVTLALLLPMSGVHLA